MFTLKLDGDCRQRIAEAEGFTVYRLSDYAVQITAHCRDANEAFYVGDSNDALTSDMASEIWYSRAIIENAAGKTSEIIAPPTKATISNRAA